MISKVQAVFDISDTYKDDAKGYMRKRSKDAACSSKQNRRKEKIAFISRILMILKV